MARAGEGSGGVAVVIRECSETTGAIERGWTSGGAGGRTRSQRGKGAEERKKGETGASPPSGDGKQD